MSNPQHEPTMEEILASIRKIISEDGPENAAPPAEAAPAPVASEPAPAPQPVHEPAPQPVHDDVLELTQEIEEVPPPPAITDREISYWAAHSAGQSNSMTTTTRTDVHPRQHDAATLRATCGTAKS